MKKKDPGYAGVFSAIFPGLGQIYNEKILRGLIFFVLSALTVLAGITLFLASFFSSSTSATNSYIIGILFLLGFYVFLWLLSIDDAQKIAHEINNM